MDSRYGTTRECAVGYLAAGVEVAVGYPTAVCLPAVAVAVELVVAAFALDTLLLLLLLL